MRGAYCRARRSGTACKQPRAPANEVIGGSGYDAPVKLTGAQCSGQRRSKRGETCAGSIVDSGASEQL
eukprot:11217075-Lingulodinium_polyedra.AAC.1